jgi:hypothetical protein
MGGAKATQPTAKRRPLSVVPDEAAEYQKASADFTQSCRKSGRPFWGAGHWGWPARFLLGAIWAPFNLGGPLFVQHSE